MDSPESRLDLSDQQPRPQAETEPVRTPRATLGVLPGAGSQIPRLPSELQYPTYLANPAYRLTYSLAYLLTCPSSAVL